jgi:hypothetical protein
MRKRQSEGLTDEQGGSFWQGQISIGSPAQQFYMYVKDEICADR